MNTKQLADNYGCILARPHHAQRVPPHVRACADAAIRQLAMKENKTCEQVTKEVISAWEAGL